MRIGLLSDTHIPEVTRSLPVEVKKAFSGVDLILHAGDIYNTSVLDELESVAPVIAAAGDDDYGATIADQRVQRKHTLKLDGHTILLIHERPYHPLVPQQASNGTQAEVDAPDIVVFGHEHRVTVLRHAGVLHINPGSPTFLHYNEGLGTVGILGLDSGEPSIHILQL